MWFISQSPREFLQQSGSKDVGQENHRRTIVDQCSTIHLFRTPRVAPETLAEFGLNDRQIAFVRDEATPGKAGKGYSECLIHFEDKHGWFPTYVEASPFEDHVLRYTPREHGDFEKYLEEIDKSIGTGRTTTETDEEESAAAGTAIEAIHGIGPTYAGRLRDEDIRTVDDLATMEPDQLATIAEAPIGEVEIWISRTNETRLNGSSPSNKTG